MFLGTGGALVWLVVGLVGMIGGGGGVAQARVPGLELRWPAVAGCPGQAEVEAAVGRLVAGGEPRAVTAVATLRREGAGWRMRLTVRDADGELTRTLTSARCQVLADAAAVILAVAAEPVAVADRVVAEVPVVGAVAAADRVVAEVPVVGAVAEPGAAAGPVVAAAGVPVVGVVAEPGVAAAGVPVVVGPRIVGPEEGGSVGPRSVEGDPLDGVVVPGGAEAVAGARVQVGVDVQGAAGLGASRRAVAGVLLGLSVRWPRVRVQARASHWFASRAAAVGREDVGVTLRLTAGTLRACPVLVRRSVELELCGGLELGVLWAQGDGLAMNRVSRGLWAAAVLAAGIRVRPLRWLGLGVELEGAAALSRHRYAVADAGQDLHSTPVLGVRGLGGLSLYFP